jgi:hypothetical protein
MPPFVYKYTGVEMRLRCNEDYRLESDIGGGIRFWGFWDWSNDYLWFMSASSESDEQFAGVRACSGVNGINSWEPIRDINITEWHTYTILWEPDNGTFLVDGKIVASISEVPNSWMNIEIWTSNRAIREYQNDRKWVFETMDVLYDSSIQVDYVHVFLTARGVQWYNDNQITGDEIITMFPKAWRAITTEVKVTGMSDMVSDYNIATYAWANRDYESTRTYLQKILEIDIPEPALLPVLGLNLLPALLRRRR